MNVDLTKQLSYEEESELKQLLTTKNNLGFNMLKVVEETTELNEVLIKGLTKPAGVDKQLLIEEMGDVAFRLAVLCEHLDIMDEVEQRCNAKAHYIYTTLKRGEYGTKVNIERT